MSVTKIVDKLGRVVIPAEWRREWGKRVVLYKLNEDEILMKALRKKGKLTDLIDSITIDEVSDFTDTHALKERLIG